MTQEHPITPPPGLIKNWCASRIYEKKDVPLHVHVATQAARWGADQELEACRLWVSEESIYAARELVEARRPKPPSLKKRALQAWAAVEAGTDDQTAMAVIRRALEQLDD